MGLLHILHLVTILASGPSVAGDAPAPLGCTAFCLAESPSAIVGKNLDWERGFGLVVSHPRGLHRDSRYGSVTFNHLGTELPLGGINEAGLVVEELSYSPSRCPDPGDRPTVDEFEWIQHLLDSCATVEEAIGEIDSVAVVRRWMGLHYFLADRSGDVAVLEFIDGKAVVYHGDDIFAPVLANDTYANLVRYLRRHAGFGGDLHETDGAESPERFVRAARRCADFGREYDGVDPVVFAFETLDAVSQHDTQWSIVYDATALEVHFRVRGRDGSRTVALGDLDLADGRRRRVMDLAGDLVAGPDSVWVDCTAAIEERLHDVVFDAFGIDTCE